MTLLVVAYPHLTATDYAWIQAIRYQHDPHATLIAPHFTLVFPLETMDQGTLVNHITAHAQQIPVIAFVIRCATIVKDALSAQTHLFLVPDEGHSALIKFHAALYTGILAPARRLDVPFIPHITVGAHTDPYRCTQVAAAINQHELCIRGQLPTVDILRYAHNRVATVHRIALR